MEDLTGKVTTDQLTAAEWNQLPQEVQNVITDTGLVLTNADLDQLGKSLMNYIGAGNFYAESGAADAYVLAPIGTKQGPDRFIDGMECRFRPGNTNTGASTVNVNSLGAKTITREDGTTALPAGDLVNTQDAHIRYDLANDVFILLGYTRSTAATVVAPRGYIDGFRIDRDSGGDTDHDLRIAEGIARSDDDTQTLTLTGGNPALVKQIDVPWAESSGATPAGGFPSGLSLTPDTWYHVLAIRRTSDGQIDAGFDTDAAGSNLLADATAYGTPRRIGSVLTDGSSNLTPFRQRDGGDTFLWQDPPLDVDVSNLSTTATNFTLSVPIDFQMLALCNVFVSQGSNNSRNVYIRPPAIDDEAPSNSAAPLQTAHKSSPEIHPYKVELETNASGTVAARSSGSSTVLRIATLGYVDPRGKSS